MKHTNSHVCQTLIAEEYENFVNAHMEVEAECISTKLIGKYKIPWKTLEQKRKRIKVKTTSLCYKRNPTSGNALKLKKAQKELIYTKQNKQNIFKARSIKLQI